MKGQTQTMVVIIVFLHRQRQGHVASLIMLLSAYIFKRSTLHIVNGKKSFHMTNWVLKLRGILASSSFRGPLECFQEEKEPMGGGGGGTIPFFPKFDFFLSLS